MGKLLDEERIRQAVFKTHSPYFSKSAKVDGVYKKHAYPFYLPRDCAQENLFDEIGQPAQDYFAKFSIKWIGQENYLGERMSKNQKRTRGAISVEPSTNGDTRTSGGGPNELWSQHVFWGWLLFFIFGGIKNMVRGHIQF